jgi:hypothetical protein
VGLLGEGKYSFLFFDILFSVLYFSLFTGLEVSSSGDFSGASRISYSLVLGGSDDLTLMGLL